MRNAAGARSPPLTLISKPARMSAHVRSRASSSSTASAGPARAEALALMAELEPLDRATVLLAEAVVEAAPRSRSSGDAPPAAGRNRAA